MRIRSVVRTGYHALVTPIFFDSHLCKLPPTADLIGREMDFECGCGRRWRLERFIGKDGSILGPSWTLL
jgi:hypothetical protein